jgi:hypothetical protein
MAGIRINKLSALQKYDTDPDFNRLVILMKDLLFEQKLTTTELQAAVDMACEGWSAKCLQKAFDFIGVRTKS